MKNNGYTCNGNPIKYNKHDTQIFWLGALLVVIPLIIMALMAKGL